MNYHKFLNILTICINNKIIAVNTLLFFSIFLNFLPVSFGDKFKLEPLIQVSDTSPFSNCIENEAIPTNGGTNFSDSEVEPWLDINPVDSTNIVAYWQQDRWSNGGANGLVLGVSLDSGTTWEKIPVPGLSKCSDGEFERASDPWISFSQNGDLYQIALAANMPLGVGKNALLVSKSTDGGLIWSDPLTIVESTVDQTEFTLHDKETITADSNDSDFVYAVWDRFTIFGLDKILPFRLPDNENIFSFNIALFKGPVMFSRTTNAGESWEPARKIYDPGFLKSTIGNQIVVLPDGTIINFFDEINGKRIDLSVLRSTDNGATWGNSKEPLRISKVTPIGITDPVTGNRLRTGDILPDIAVDHTTGNLYAVWQDGRFNNFKFDSIAFVMSEDGGLTWSRPIKINKTPTKIDQIKQQAFTPSIHVADDGIIGVTYYDFRFYNDETSSLETDYFFLHCQHSEEQSCTNPDNWKEEMRLTDESFNIRQAPSPNGLFIGDYQGLTSDSNDFLALFSQTHGSDSASVFFRRIRSIE